MQSNAGVWGVIEALSVAINRYWQSLTCHTFGMTPRVHLDQDLFGDRDPSTPPSRAVAHRLRTPTCRRATVFSEIDL